MNNTAQAGLFAGIFAVLTAVAALKEAYTGFVIALLALVGLSIAYLWQSRVFRRLTIERSLSQTTVPWGRTVEYRLQVVNRKFLPVFGMEIRDEVPTGVEFAEKDRVVKVRGLPRSILRDTMTVMWYERRTRRYLFTAERRGLYEFGPGSLTSRDPFGLFPQEAADVLEPAKLVVLPRVVPLIGAEALDTALFGTRQREGWIFTDPLHKAGTRPYQRGDSARKINWKASARHLQLQVDVEKPAFDEEIELILLQPDRARWWEQQAANRLELAIMLAASLVNRYGSLGQKFRLHTNLASSRSVSSRVPANTMVQLALLQNFSLRGGETVLCKAARGLRTASSIVVIIAGEEIPESWTAVLRRLSQKHRVILIHVGGIKPQPGLPGVRQFQVDGEVKWDETAQFELH